MMYILFFILGLAHAGYVFSLTGRNFNGNRKNTYVLLGILLIASIVGVWLVTFICCLYIQYKYTDNISRFMKLFK